MSSNAKVLTNAAMKLPWPVYWSIVVLIAGVLTGFLIAVLVESDRDRERWRQMALLSTIIGHVDSGIVALDPQGSIVYWSDGAERMFGWASVEVVGKPADFLIPEEMAQVHALAFRDPARRSALISGEVRIVRCDAKVRSGGTILVEVSVQAASSSCSLYFVASITKVTKIDRVDEPDQRGGEP